MLCVTNLPKYSLTLVIRAAVSFYSFLAYIPDVSARVLEFIAEGVSVQRQFRDRKLRKDIQVQVGGKL